MFGASSHSIKVIWYSVVSISKFFAFNIHVESKADIAAAFGDVMLKYVYLLHNMNVNNINKKECL